VLVVVGEKQVLVRTRVGYIWPAREEWGVALFESRTAKFHFEYGYDRERKPKCGEILVFYHKKRLIGMVPVDEDARRTTPKDYKRHKEWDHHWKYIVGLDGTRKIMFKPPRPVEDIAEHVEVLAQAVEDGKNLHNVCRFAPGITPRDYEFLSLL